MNDEKQCNDLKLQILNSKIELELAFDTIPDMVVLENGAGSIMRANKSFATRLGLQPQDIIGRSLDELLGTDKASIEQTREVRMTFPGLPGVYQLYSNPLLNDDGDFVGRVVVIRDVTASVKIRETLSSVEGKYKSIFDHAPVGIFQSTPFGTYLSVNRTMARMFGFREPKEMIQFYTDIGRQMYVNPEDCTVAMAAAFFADSTAGRDVNLVRHDGTRFWGRLRGRLVRDPLGNVMYYEGFIEDVTNRRSARENLARSEQRFRNLAENMHQGLVQTTPDGGMVYCNDHFCGLVGRSREELLGHQFQEFVHAEDVAECRDIFLSDVCLLPEAKFDLRLRVHDEVRFILLTPVVLQEEDGRQLGYWLLVLDITDRRMLESQLLQTQKLEAIGHLAAGIAHEINTPTQYVMNNMWFIKEGVENLGHALAACRETVSRGGAAGDATQGQEWLRLKEEELQVGFYLEELPAAIAETMQGLERISAIVKSVKQFAHPGHDRQQEVDLNELVEKTVTVSRNEWKYVAEMTTDLDPELPYVVCSSQEIGQVLLNLVVNAAHAIMDMPKEPGRMGRIIMATRKLGALAEIRVQDSGTGIPVHAQAHLFEPFFTTKAVGKGTGQGLFIAHRVVVRDHGGSIRFETEPGRGTTFIITLPIAGKNEHP